MGYKEIIFGMKFALYFMMKCLIYIPAILIMFVSGCGNRGNSDLPDVDKDTNRVSINDTNTVTVYDTVKIPVTPPSNKTYTKRNNDRQNADYVPPRDGGVNKYWYGNRNRKLSNDSNCYFGKGRGNKHRYRWGQNN
jgi:predicted small lipoprotein YifL